MKGRPMKGNLFLFILFVVALFLSINSSVSYAQLTNDDLPDRTGYKVFGDNKIIAHAAMATLEQLDTNIFLTNTNRRHDFITILNPSVGIEIPSKNGNVSADWDVSQYLYGIHEDQNHLDQRVRGLMEYNPASYLKVTINDTFDIFTNRAANENSARIRQKINAFRAGIEGFFELLTLDVGYNNRLETYDSNDLVFAQLTYEDKDRDINFIDATVTYQFLPKTAFFLQNDLGFIRYYNSSQPPDSYYDETLIGAKGAWFSKANINFKAGFRYQSYSKSDVITDKDYIGPVFGGGFDYHPTDRDTIVVNLMRTVFESTYSNMNYYNSNFFGIDYKHDFNDKVSANLFGAYELHLYPSESTENGMTAKRVDNYFRAGGSIRYDMRRWISMEARYEYVQRDSKFDIFNYFDNIATARLTAGF